MEVYRSVCDKANSSKIADVISEIVRAKEVCFINL